MQRGIESTWRCVYIGSVTCGTESPSFSRWRGAVIDRIMDTLSTLLTFMLTFII